MQVTDSDFETFDCCGSTFDKGRLRSDYVGGYYCPRCDSDEYEDEVDGE